MFIATALSGAAWAGQSVTFFSRPSAGEMRVSDLSADGATVVGSASWSSGQGPGGNTFEVWKWTAATGAAHLGYSEMGGSTTWPAFVSGDGSVFAYTAAASWPQAVRVSAGGTSMLPRPGGPSTTAEARELSADGRVVVGQAQFPSPGGTLLRAVWWYLDGFGGNLGVLGPEYGGESRAWAVNDNGGVIVGDTGTYNGRAAFRWTGASGMVGLGQLTPGRASSAVAVSADGSAIYINAEQDMAWTEGPPVISRACRWTAEGGLEALALPAFGPGGQSPQVLCCSGDGAIAGGLGPSHFSGTEAILWHPRLGPINLNSYLPLQGVNLQGRRLQSVDRLSGDGRTMTGRAINGTVREAYVLTFDFAPPCGAADIGGQGAVAGGDDALDNNDFIVFISYFFGQNMSVDVGHTGGAAGPDGRLDNNDFIAFIDLFFAGCD